MALDSEAIWAALLDRLTNETSGFTTVTRALKAQYGIEQYPLLEIVEKDETLSTDENGLPPLYTLSGVIGIAVRVNGDDSPWTKLNALIRSVRTALERKPTDTDAGPYYGASQHWTNLGGLVSSLTVGRVEKTPGEASGEAWAQIVIEMTAL